MPARILAPLAAVATLVLSACSSMQPEPTPNPPMNRAGGPPVDESTPNTGGALFNGN